jgi:hypothetical protein
VVVAALAAGGLTAVPRPSGASCQAPQNCWVREVRIAGCEVIDAATQPNIKRYLEGVDRDGQRDRSKALQRGYSGVYLETAVVGTSAVKCASGKRAGEIWGHPFGSTQGDKRATFFLGGVERSCAPYPAGKVLRIREIESCCDGTDEPPCLYHGFGGSGGLVRAKSRADAAPAADDWVPAGRTRDDTATIYLHKRFGKKSGTFKAEPDSVLDQTRTVSGEFLVGTYRFAYDKVIGEPGAKFDELTVVELLDCRRSYFGTIKRTRSFMGHPVDAEVTKEADLLMTQVTTPSVDAQLCDVHDGKPPRRLK